MGFKHQVGDDLSSGGSFLREPGTYHVCVVDVNYMPSRKDGTLIDNAAFKVYLEVLAGTVAGQEGKSAEITFFHPKVQSKNEGAFARKKIDRFLLAVGLISEADKTKEVEPELELAKGRHFIVKLELDDDEKYLQVAFADIYHVDDPCVKEVPKNAAAMAIGASWRLAGAKKPAPSKKPTPPSSKAADDFSDC